MTVDGTYNGTVGDDTFTVSGIVDGAGAIGLLAGDDVLTINDTGVIAGLANPLDGGAHTPAGDSVVLNFASNRAFGAGNIINFENLVKQGGGTATTTGSFAFSGGVTVSGGGLTVAGALETPTLSLADNTVLNVNGSLDAGGVASSITGTAGTNTVTVGTAGTLLASGDLGAGADTLDVLGSLDVGGGSFLLGDGNDNFIVHDNTRRCGNSRWRRGLRHAHLRHQRNGNRGRTREFRRRDQDGHRCAHDHRSRRHRSRRGRCARRHVEHWSIGECGCACGQHARHTGRRGGHAERRGQLWLRNRRRHVERVRHRFRCRHDRPVRRRGHADPE